MGARDHDKKATADVHSLDTVSYSAYTKVIARCGLTDQMATVLVVSFSSNLHNTRTRTCTELTARRRSWFLLIRVTCRAARRHASHRPCRQKRPSSVPFSTHFESSCSKTKANLPGYKDVFAHKEPRSMTVDFTAHHMHTPKVNTERRTKRRCPCPPLPYRGPRAPLDQRKKNYTPREKEKRPEF